MIFGVFRPPSQAPIRLTDKVTFGVTGAVGPRDLRCKGGRVSSGMSGIALNERQLLGPSI